MNMALIPLLYNLPRRGKPHGTKKIQDTWDAKFPWVKPIIGEDGKIHHVKC
jgi:hypothetical protein